MVCLCFSIFIEQVLAPAPQIRANLAHQLLTSLPDTALTPVPGAAEQLGWCLHSRDAVRPSRLPSLSMDRGQGTGSGFTWHILSFLPFEQTRVRDISCPRNHLLSCPLLQAVTFCILVHTRSPVLPARMSTASAISDCSCGTEIQTIGGEFREKSFL